MNKKLSYIDIACFAFPVLLCLLFAVLLCSSFLLNFSLTELKEYKTAYKLIFGLIVFLPLLQFEFFIKWNKSLWHRKLLLISLAALLISLNYNLHYGVKVSFIFYACAAIFAIREKKLYKISGLAYLFFAYFLLHAISLLWTNDLNNGFFMLQRYLSFVAVPLFFCCFRLTKEETNLILLVFFRAMLLFIFYSLCSWVLESRFLEISLVEWLGIKKMPLGDKPVSDSVFAWSNYTHPAYNAVGYIFVLAMSFYFFKNKITAKSINITELLFVCISTLLLADVTQSRFGVVAWGLVMFMGLAFLLRRNKKLLAAYLTATVIAGLFFVYLGSDKISGFVSDPIRVQNFKTAFASIEEHGILKGTGVGGMAAVMDSHELAEKLGYDYANVRLSNPHHQFIGDLMQTGIWGLGLLLAMIAYLFYYSIKNRRWLLFFFIAFFLLIMNTETPLALQKGIMYFVVIVCFLQQKYNLSLKNEKH